MLEGTEGSLGKGGNGVVWSETGSGDVVKVEVCIYGRVG